MDNGAIAALFDQIGALLEIKGENRFKIREEDDDDEEQPARAGRAAAAPMARPKMMRLPAAPPAPAAPRAAAVPAAHKVGRNDPCPCGSGKKYKRCHGTAA